VKPYVKSNQNDANDAQAICEAMSRPRMRYVAVKTVGQQDMQAVHRVRASLITERTAKANQLRGLIYEYGLVAPREIATIAREDEAVQRIEQLRGIGPLTASALVALVGDGRKFKNGRQLAVALGLTPRQHNSGGKDRLLRISKRGDTYVRTLMIHGARLALRTATGKTDRLSRWALALAERSHPNVAATALADKVARVAWAMLRHGTSYEPERVAAWTPLRVTD
jgi:transposase